MAGIKPKGSKKGSGQKSGKAYIETTQWHPVFFQAIQLELEAYREHLTYENEHHLTTEPLRVDILIIKKDPELRVEKNIGRIFRGHNVVEFKGPEDSLSIHDYHKVLGYAHLYCFLEKAPPQDITITIALTVKPEALLAYLKTRPDITVDDKYSGIKYINGELFPIQLIENSLLDARENAWMRALSQGTPVPVIKDIITAHNKAKIESGAFWHAVFRENYDAIMEVMAEMGRTAFDDFLDEIGYIERSKFEWAMQNAQKKAQKKEMQKDATIISLKDLIQKQEKEKMLLQKQAEEEKNRLQRQAEESIRGMLQDGVSIEIISKNLFVSIEEVERIQKGL